MNLQRPATFWIAAFAAVLVLVALLRDILLPFLAGIALAYLLDPVVARLQRLGLNRSVAAFAILSLFVVAVGDVAVVAIPIIGTELADFIEKVPVYIAQLRALVADPSRPWLRKIVGEELSAEQSAGEIARFAANWIPSLLLWSDSQALISVFSLLIVTPIVTFYMLRDWKRLFGAADTVQKLADELDDTISGFLRGQPVILHLRSQPWNSHRAFRWSDQFHSLSRVVSWAAVCVAVLQFWPSWTMIPVVLRGRSLCDEATSRKFA